MLLLCAVFALLTVGFVVPCVIDIAMTPRHHFGVPSKKMWLSVTVTFWAFGAATWLLLGRRDVRMRAAYDELSDGLMVGEERGLWESPSRTAGLRYRSGSSRRTGISRREDLAGPPVRFIAPDDNADFLLELERRIRDWREHT